MEFFKFGLKSSLNITVISRCFRLLGRRRISLPGDIPNGWADPQLPDNVCAAMLIDFPPFI